MASLASFRQKTVEAEVGGNGVFEASELFLNWFGGFGWLCFDGEEAQSARMKPIPAARKWNYSHVGFVANWAGWNELNCDLKAS